MLERAKSMGLTEREYRTIERLLGRKPTLIELGVFALNWSEHCSYKSTRRLLRLLPSKSDRTLKGPGAGAGVLKLDENTVVAFKIESHNHPSAVEPKHGAATGVGGIVRDVLSMGVRPVALLDSLRFGDFRRDKRSLHLLKGVVEGIAWYGNSIGVPVVGGEVFVSETYEDNPLVNVMCVGVGRREDLKEGVLKGIGNSVLIVGAPTGKDGIMGASFASQSFEGDISENRPAVQIGDPFMEKLLIEATLEAVRLPQVLGMQDLGAGGLSTALPEMAENGGVGVELDTSLVPTREPLTPYEVVLSESQERMVLCVEAGKEEEVIEIYRRWGLEATVIGKVIKERVFRIKEEDRLLAEIPLGVLFSGLPDPGWLAIEEPFSLDAYLRIVERLVGIYESASKRRRSRIGAVMQIFGFSSYPVGDAVGLHVADQELRRKGLNLQRRALKGENVRQESERIAAYQRFIHRIASSRKEPEVLLPVRYVREVALKVLSDPNVASKRWIYKQYDHMVGTDTLILPGEGDAALLRVKGKNYALAVSVDGNGKYLAMDPYWGALKVAFEVILNLTLTGGEAIGFTDGVNFPSPEDPHTYHKLQEALRGLGDFAKEFGIPVVSGNVSLYNESDRRKIFPTLIVGGVALVRDVFSVPKMGVDREGLHVYTVGFHASPFDLGGSEFLSVLLKDLGLNGMDENELFGYYRKPEPYHWDLFYLKEYVSALSEMIRIGLVINAHDVSEGGLFAALSEMVLQGEMGMKVRVEGFGELFSETVPKVVLTTSMPKELETYLSRRGLPYERIGTTVPEPVLRINYHGEREIVLTRQNITEAYFSTYEVDGWNS
ncbi:MAG: phosphoribosylformylglycinamidine synthase subunit PurL [Thermotogae bacterium]|nr:phosphoribosylformylglycinamidine synthase subunit PurL [Thermotogota bacterium]